jgi:hypothetical protein
MMTVMINAERHVSWLVKVMIPELDKSRQDAYTRGISECWEARVTTRGGRF